jgi:CRP-like cAMP-binding protein
MVRTLRWRKNQTMQFRNAFLSAMAADDLAELSPFLREIALFGGEVLSEPNAQITSIYFPSNSTISIVTAMSDGREVETVSIGFESVAGLLPALTRISPTTRMRVQIGGGAISLPAIRLCERAKRSPQLMRLILRFAQDRAAQAEQSAACYALHPLPARLARWLLICEDRVDRSTMLLTQDEMGVMAGALRSSISMLASDFKQQGLSNYSRGHLQILDRPRLEAQACECYAADRARRSADELSALASGPDLTG